MKNERKKERLSKNKYKNIEKKNDITYDNFI